jgi:hypothetical protein
VGGGGDVVVRISKRPVVLAQTRVRVSLFWASFHKRYACDFDFALDMDT